MIRAADLIERKRSGDELSDEEIAELILGYARGDVPELAEPLCATTRNTIFVAEKAA